VLTRTIPFDKVLLWSKCRNIPNIAEVKEILGSMGSQEFYPYPAQMVIQM
jgi:hypothetical protein